MFNEENLTEHTFKLLWFAVNLFGQICLFFHFSVQYVLTGKLIFQEMLIKFCTQGSETGTAKPRVTYE